MSATTDRTRTLTSRYGATAQGRVICYPVALPSGTVISTGRMDPDTGHAEQVTIFTPEQEKEYEEAIP